MCPPELLDTGTPSRKDAPCGGEWLSRAVQLYPSRFFSFSRNRQNWTANASQSSKSLNSKRHGISGIPRENGPSSLQTHSASHRPRPREANIRTFECKFWPEDDGWKGVCAELSISVHGDNFEHAKKNMKAALQAFIGSMLRERGARIAA